MRKDGEGERWKRNIKKWGSRREREREREDVRVRPCVHGRTARTLPALSLSLSLSLFLSPSILYWA